MIGLNIIGALILGHGVGAGISYYLPDTHGWHWLRGWHFHILDVPYFIYPLVVGASLLAVAWV
jgi:hypothetical protein